MVRIRLRRVGSRNQPSYRIVVADKESPRDGRFIEVIGHYNPRTEPSTVNVDEGRLFYWMKNGAQPSDAVTQALRAGGTWDRWERFKGGEDLEVLLAEAEAARVEVDPRTRRDDLIGARRKKAKGRARDEEKSAEEAEASAEAPAVDEPPAEESEAPADEPAAEAGQPVAEAEAPADEPAEEAEQPAVEAEAPADEPAAEAEQPVEEAAAPEPEQTEES